MRRVLASLAIIGLLISPLTAQADGPITHIVQPGENLFRIGLRYGLTARQIASANNLSSVSQIYAGQRLVIPAAGAANAPAYAPAAAAQSYHVVQPGENLFRVALRYGLSVQALAAANNIVTFSQVYVGQRLLIPGSAAPAPQARREGGRQAQARRQAGAGALRPGRDPDRRSGPLRLPAGTSEGGFAGVAPRAG